MRRQMENRVRNIEVHPQYALNEARHGDQFRKHLVRYSIVEQPIKGSRQRLRHRSASIKHTQTSHRYPADEALHCIVIPVFGKDGSDRKEWPRRTHLVRVLVVARICQRHAALSPVGEKLCCRQPLQHCQGVLLRQAAKPGAVTNGWIQIGNFIPSFAHSIVVVSERRIPEHSLQRVGGEFLAPLGLARQIRIIHRPGQLCRGAQGSNPLAGHG